MLTRVIPACAELEPWITIAVVNWTEGERNFSVEVNKIIASLRCSRVLVFEFFTQEVLGIFDSEDRIELGPVAPHASRLLRIAPWHGYRPVLAGTDLHFSGGGVEISSWKESDDFVHGKIATPWDYPIKITAVFPDVGKTGYVVNSVVAMPRQESFWIGNPAAEN